MHAPSRLRPLLAALSLALSLVAWVLPSRALDQREGDWQYLTQKSGVTIWKREIPGNPIPGLRGQVVMNAGLDHILKVMLDSSKHTEWMYACVESTVLKDLGHEHAIMYNRVGAPWPVWDRDVIADTRIERYPEQKHAIARFENVSSDLRPVPKRVVRLPLLKGFYKLWEVAPGKTKVLYQVEADLGGSIPTWLANVGARDMPYHTLSSLRERAESH
jgi:START domain